MFTLHTVTEQIKTIAKWILIGIVGIIILILIFRIIGAIRKALTPPPAPTVTFGKLPQIVFPEYTKQENTKYVIDTVSGSLPTFPDRLPVFKTIPPTPTLQNLANARGKIAGIGFASSFNQTITESALSETKYQWSDNNTPPRILTMDIDSYDFLLSTSYVQSISSSSALLSAKSLTANSGITVAKNLLTNMGLLPHDVDTGSINPATSPRGQLLRRSDTGTDLQPADPSTAQAIRVDLMQKNLVITDPVDTAFHINSLQIYYPSPYYSPINGIFVPGEGLDPIVAAFSYHHQVISDESATYPIITSAQAFQLLQRGGGYAYIALHDENPNIAIKSVELGYYLSEDKVDYVMPIIVFKGDATPDGKYNFYAYVPAIQSTFLRK